MLPLPTQPFVSFDVFDTLIKRSVAQPTDLFYLMERLQNENCELPVGFAAKRIAAEVSLARRERPATLEQIYEVLQQEYGDRVQKWLQAEVEMELAGCQPYPPCVDLLKRCVAAGRTVLIISDMYLSSVIIGQMLAKCGVTGYKKLYVSCEWGARKRDGSLFKVVLRDAGIKAGELCHVGDRWKSDWLQPSLLGIKSKHISNRQKQLCKAPKNFSAEEALGYRTLQACIANCSYNMTKYERWGCSNLGPLLLGYSNWLLSQLQKQDIHDVYFFSRDGWLLLQAFNMVRPGNIKGHYMYASRRAYVVPLMRSGLDFEMVSRLIKRLRGMSLRRFLLKIGLNPDTYILSASKAGLNLDAVYTFEKFWVDERIKKYYQDYIRANLEEKAREEYEGLHRYLLACRFPPKIGVADIGYTGTIQYVLEEMLQKAKLPTAVQGYYVGMTSLGKADMRNSIVAAGYQNEVLCEEALQNMHLYEAQLLSKQGSLERFEIQGTKVIPQLLPCEYATENGKIVDELAIMAEYQKGALGFVKFMQGLHKEKLPLEPEVATYNWLRMSNKPSLEEANFWGDFRFLDGDVFYLAAKQEYRSYVLHPVAVLRDFKNAKWKIGYLKRIFKLPLPYASMVGFMRLLYRKFYNRKNGLVSL